MQKQDITTLDLNTGGDVTIKTGKASVDASVSTVANVNSARVSGGATGATSNSFFHDYRKRSWF